MFGIGMNFGSSFLVGGAGSLVVDGEIESPFIIGDDYLAANDRAFVWVVPKITGFVTASCTCHFGVLSVNGFDNFVVDGAITDYDDDSWQISFDVAKVETSGFKPGPYNWSASVKHSGVEITSVKPVNRVLQMIRKYA